MKFASAVFGGRKLNAVRADAMRRRADDLCRVLRRKRQMCLSPIQTRSYCHRVLGGGLRGEPDGEGQVWPGLVVSIIQIDHKCLPGLCGNRFCHIFEHVNCTPRKCVFKEWGRQNIHNTS